MKITPIKGRPMLHWVGKRPIDTVNSYPAQLVETYNVENPEKEPTYDKFLGGPNLLFHGDNKDILSTLLVQGFRGKIDLIYIDPPFNSGADYVRKVKLRGDQRNLEGEGHTVIEQTQYTDIWANDNYLQFMYERLILMRELLSEKGSLYLHCDWHKNHYLRCLLDEVFEPVNFVNEIIWCYTGPSRKNRFFARKHDAIYLYSKKKDNIIFNTDKIKVPYKKHRTGTSKGSAFLQNDYEMDKAGKIPEDWWELTPVGRKPNELLGFPTQKPEALLDRIIKASTNEDSIVLDCFVGSGTTPAVADKLGRRWIAADLNKGAIQTTLKRIQNNSRQTHGIAHYRINNYDFQTQHELKQIIIAKYGVQTDRKATFFDGTLDSTLVKIADLRKPLTRLDIQLIKDELRNSPDETRNITVLCNGSEVGIQVELDKDNRHRPINKIVVRDIQREGITTYAPAEAEVHFERVGLIVKITISDYLSPSILARMERERSVFDEQLGDFRAQIDCVLIDTDYSGEHFTIVESDVPESRGDFIEGQYKVTLPRPDARVAVKIIDMLGEETIVTD